MDPLASSECIKKYIKRLDSWFAENKRQLPWRENRTPYRTLIAEVMLQQTRAEVVVSYYKRWMEKFPDLSSLAQASEEVILKAWEGLGYYSRARNLRRLSLELMGKHKGIFPQDEKELKRLPGIGEYTAGAIRMFSYKKRGYAIDGNVERVLSRVFCIKERTQTAAFRKQIQSAYDRLIDQGTIETGEALIELGARVCVKTPKCQLCPLKGVCKGKEDPNQYPNKKPRQKISKLFRVVLVFSYQNKYLVIRREKNEVMGGLYEFPYVEGEEHSIQQLTKKFTSHIKQVESLKIQKHAFTRFHVSLKPYHIRLSKPFSLKNHTWKDKKELSSAPFSSGHRLIANELCLSFD